MISYILEDEYKWKIRSLNFTVDTYRLMLETAEFLEHTKTGEYKKLENIPSDLTTTRLRNYLNFLSWQKWFVGRDRYLGIERD